MEKKKGFIAISLIYSFFLCFLMLMAGMLANYAHTKLIVNKINEPLTLTKEPTKSEPEVPIEPEPEPEPKFEYEALCDKYKDVKIPVTGEMNNGKPKYTEVNIGSADQLRSFSCDTNQTNYDGRYQNSKINLTGNIDLAGEEFEQINGWNTLSGATIDGGNYTIRNMTIVASHAENGTGFIYSKAGSLTIKNLKFDHASAKDCGYAFVGIVIGKIYSPTTINNVTISNSEVISDWKGGGYIGSGFEGAQIELNNCRIENSYVWSTSFYPGYIYGSGPANLTIKNNTASNVTLYSSEGTSNSFNGIVGGTYGYDLVLENINENKVKFKKTTDDGKGNLCPQ